MIIKSKNMSNSSEWTQVSASYRQFKQGQLIFQHSQGINASFLNLSPSDVSWAKYSHQFFFSLIQLLFPSAIGLVFPSVCFVPLAQAGQINEDSSPRLHQHQQKCIYLHRGPIGVKSLLDVEQK